MNDSPPHSAETSPPESASTRATPGELALFFLRLGATAFGGPAAHVAMLEDEVVAKKRWVERQRFLDLLAVANLIPGPSSTELAIYIGYEQCGLVGLLLAGVCFILPAFLIVLAIAWAYKTYGALPAIGGIAYGAVPVLIPILLQAAWRLGRSAIKTRTLAAVAIVAGLLAFSRHFLPADYRIVSYPLVVLLTSGALNLLIDSFRRPALPPAPRASAGFLPLWPFAAGAAGTAATLVVPLTVTGLFLVFLKVGALIFGSGYVLLPFLQEELIERRGWLTEAVLSVAVTVGQVTPGPVFTTATFIGYYLSGFAGAVAATAGIFCPAFILVAITGPFVRRLRGWAGARTFLDGLNVAAVALIVEISWTLGRPALIDLPACAIALVSGILLFSFRVNSSWLVLGGAMIGLLLRGL